MNIKDSLKFGVMIGLLEVHKVHCCYLFDDTPLQYYLDVDDINVILL